MAKADKKSPEFAEKREELKRFSAEIKDAEKALGEVEAKIQTQLAVVPNVPDPGVPEGKGEEDNQVLRTWGDKPSFSFTPKAHWEVGTALLRASSTSSAPPSSRGPASTVLFGAAARDSSGRSSPSCSTCTPATRATPRCSRPSW